MNTTWNKNTLAICVLDSGLLDVALCRWASVLGRDAVSMGYFFLSYLLACSITLVISNTTCYLHLIFTIIVSSLLFDYFVCVLRFLPF